MEQSASHSTVVTSGTEKLTHFDTIPQQHMLVNAGLNSEYNIPLDPPPPYAATHDQCSNFTMEP